MIYLINYLANKFHLEFIKIITITISVWKYNLDFVTDIHKQRQLRYQPLKFILNYIFTLMNRQQNYYLYCFAQLSIGFSLFFN